MVKIDPKKKKEMLEYLVENLRDPLFHIEPKSGEIVSGITSRYVKIGDKDTKKPDRKIVVLVDDIYTKDKLKRLYEKVRQYYEKDNVALVLLKDGETFFRSDAQRMRKKMTDERSLKHYSHEDVNRMIKFRPEEKFLMKARDKVLQYYQPESERLEEGIVTYKFKPVVFNYSHIPERERFTREEVISRGTFIWDKDNKKLNQGKLKVKNGYLVSQ